MCSFNLLFHFWFGGLHSGPFVFSGRPALGQCGIGFGPVVLRLAFSFARPWFFVLWRFGSFGKSTIAELRQGVSIDLFLACFFPGLGRSICRPCRGRKEAFVFKRHSVFVDRTCLAHAFYFKETAFALLNPLTNLQKAWLEGNQRPRFGLSSNWPSPLGKFLCCHSHQPNPRGIDFFQGHPPIWEL